MNSTSKQPSTLAAWPLAICQALEAIGIDPEPLLACADLNRAEFIDQPDGRINIEKMTRFWQAVEDTCEDSAFALSVANYVQPMHFRALGLLMLTTKNLESALLKLGQYSQLISNSVTTRTETKDELIGLCIDPIIGIKIHPMSIDSFFSTLLAFTNQLGALTNPIDHVELMREKPPQSDNWQERFKAPVHFSAPQNCLWFKRDKLGRSGVMGDEKLAAFNESVVKEYINNLNSDHIRLKVKNIIIALLETGEPSIQVIASQLHMSERSLRRRLKEEDINFRDVLKETRMDLAKHYLLQTQLPITTISLQLGFTDSSNFTRAFTRWFSQSPSQYRQTQSHP
jgi:AraC-like DNA-binding protein